MAVSNISAPPRTHLSGLREGSSITRDVAHRVVLRHTNRLFRVRLAVTFVFIVLFSGFAMTVVRAPAHIPLYLVVLTMVTAAILSGVAIFRNRCPRCGALFARSHTREEAVYTEILYDSASDSGSPAAAFPHHIYSTTCKRCARPWLFVK